MFAKFQTVQFKSGAVINNPRVCYKSNSRAVKNGSLQSWFDCFSLAWADQLDHTWESLKHTLNHISHGSVSKMLLCYEVGNVMNYITRYGMPKESNYMRSSTIVIILLQK